MTKKETELSDELKKKIIKAFKQGVLYIDTTIQSYSKKKELSMKISFSIEDSEVFSIYKKRQKFKHSNLGYLIIKLAFDLDLYFKDHFEGENLLLEYLDKSVYDVLNYLDPPRPN
ncbi:MAG TPA: hypothetical protein P5060_01340 [Candidatus Absconditabacterales bacterium]|nr:hypothetical protein [Candidatus Absconditabacterales bacterium]